MTEPSIVDKIRDPYDLKARVMPGLWVIFPLLATAACLIGPDHPVVTALFTLSTACGGLYLLSSLVRSWGRTAQARLWNKWGGMPSTIILRHRDSEIDKFSKKSYHSIIGRKLGLSMPSHDDELKEPRVADDLYRAASEHLLHLTRNRSQFPLVFKELVAYGFARNMYGARWVGAAICILSSAIVLFHSNVLDIGDFSFNYRNVSLMSIGEWITLGTSVGLLFMWLCHFRENAVRQAGFTYARRLIEAAVMLDDFRQDTITAKCP